MNEDQRKGYSLGLKDARVETLIEVIAIVKENPEESIQKLEALLEAAE